MCFLDKITLLLKSNHQISSSLCRTKVWQILEKKEKGLQPFQLLYLSVTIEESFKICRPPKTVMNISHGLPSMPVLLLKHPVIPLLPPAPPPFYFILSHGIPSIPITLLSFHSSSLPFSHPPPPTAGSILSQKRKHSDARILDSSTRHEDEILIRSIVETFLWPYATDRLSYEFQEKGL